MDDPAAARRSFLHAQVRGLGPLDFIVVGLPQPPFDAVQARLEEDGTYIVEIASRDETAPFSAEQAAALETLGFTAEATTWAGKPSADVAGAVEIIERVLVAVLAVEPETPVDVRHGSLREERAAETKLASMRAFIEPALERMLGKPAPVDGDGDYVVDTQGMTVVVAPRSIPGRPPIIRVFCITNAGMNLNADLGLFLARLNFSLAFGRFSIDTDHRSVWFDETLLGDHVTQDELVFVIDVVAQTAAEWDEKIASMFGGTYRQEPQQGGPDAASQGPVTAPAKPGQGGYL